MHVISSFWHVPRKKKRKQSNEAAVHWLAALLCLEFSSLFANVIECRPQELFFSFATCTGVFILYHEASSMLSLYPSFFPHFRHWHSLEALSFFFFFIFNADKLSNKQKTKKSTTTKKKHCCCREKKTVLLCVLKRKGEEPKKQT